MNKTATTSKPNKIMTPQTFAGSAVVLVGLLGLGLLFTTPGLGIALIALAAAVAYRVSQDA